METKYNNILNPDDFYNGPSDEELKDFLEYMEKGAVHEDNVEFEVDQLRKRTAAELGKHECSYICNYEIVA